MPGLRKLLSHFLFAISFNSLAQEHVKQGAPILEFNEPSRNMSQLGFFSASEAGIPKEITEASKSVFLIATPAGDFVSVKELFEGRPLADVIKALEHKKPDEDMSQGEIDVLLFQLRKCLAAKLKEDCKVYDSTLISSAYVVGDGTRLRTAFHAVKDVIKDSVNLKKLDKNQENLAVEVPVFVYSTNGSPVMGPSKAALPVAEFSRDNLRFLVPEDGKITLPNDDLVEVKFKDKIGSPLRAAKKPIQPGDPIYLVGYPSKSKDRAAFKTLDAPGDQLRITRGKVLTVDQAFAKTGKDPEKLPQAVRDFYQKAMILSDADGRYGLSGGATFNSNGEVVGTFTSSYPADGSASEDHVSYSSNDFYKLKTPKE